MALPSVKVNITNGALGSAPANQDGLSAMSMAIATAPSGLAFNTPKLINSLPEAADLGINATDTPFAYRQIKGFYDGFNYATGSEVAPLYIILFADTVALADMADKAGSTSAQTVLDYAQGNVRLLGIARDPDGSYTPTVTDGIDSDSLLAADAAQTMATTMATAGTPLRVLIEARAFAIANLGTLKDLRTLSDNRVGLVLGSSLNDGSADVGFTLGVAAGLPVQRNIGRVKNGPLLPVTSAYIGDTSVEDAAADLGGIHDKGYIIYRTYNNRSGYYFNDDPMCAPTSDDYSQLGRGRVIDKAQRIAVNVYTDEINDDFEAESDGTLSDGVTATLQAAIDKAVNQQMAGEISSFTSSVPSGQNVVSTNKVTITGKAVPRGYFKEIDMDLGFTLN